MKYRQIANEVFFTNRSKFCSKLNQKSLVLLNSNDEFPRSGDQNHVFKQNADLFYLSGIDQEQTILLLFPDCPNPLYREVLFLRQTNEHIAVWEGHKYTREEAEKVSGIKKIYWLSEFDAILSAVIFYADHIYLNTNENDRYTHAVSYRDLRFIQQLKEKYPLHQYLRAAPIFRDLRAVKSSAEIELISKACQLTNDAFFRVLKFVKPGVGEYEIEAEIIHEFIRQRGTGHAYNPIIASGKNANILHYNDNNQICLDGDVILMDFDAVLRVMKESIQLLQPGLMWNAYHEEVGKIMTSELIGLGLLDEHDVANQNPEMPLYKKYFMHGNSHHLGLDVHDFAGRYTPFAVGNVLTVEPGIYIPAEGLGIRLENNILITENGTVDLMADIPLEADHIEEIMNA
ncbi:MAG: M24 family metallopeptidase [Sphingobacteriaceae bacterium]|nr:MAG: M24 family metallopeptidase [Sphingobacteriaceae bacterium]